MPVVPAFRKVRQKNVEVEANQGCIAKPCLQTSKKKERKQKRKKEKEKRKTNL
jgi:hypothetical protein